MIDIEDESQLLPYLYGRFPVLSATSTPPSECSVSVLSGGVSNRTVRVAAGSRRAWVFKQALDKLRVPVDWYCSPDRIHREALGMELLTEILGPDRVPTLVFEDRDNNLLAMTAVQEPFENWKAMLLAGRLERRHVRQFARMLAALHSGGVRRSERLPQELFDLTYFWNLRLEPYYRYSGEQVPIAESFLSELIESYEDARATIVHGDFSPKNILIRRNRSILLDHEVIHYGDPAFDLGFSLTHLLSNAHLLDRRRSDYLGAARSYWNQYRRALTPAAVERFGAGFERRVVEHTMGCLLARVVGRSQLEYLGPEKRERQGSIVARMIEKRPGSADELILEFGSALAD